jgi:mRNA interferase HicA
MKQRDLIKKLKQAGFTLAGRGSNLDIYKRGSEEEQVPRHREINELTAQEILRRWGLR